MENRGEGKDRLVVQGRLPGGGNIYAEFKITNFVLPNLKVVRGRSLKVRLGKPEAGVWKAAEMC